MFLHPRSRFRELRTFADEAMTVSLASNLERRPLDGIKERQGRLLRWIVHYAYHNVPFYRYSFDAAGVTPSSIRSLDDAEKLPVLTKREVVDNFPSGIVTRGFSAANSFRSASSGTSGVRGTFLSDWPTRDSNFALLFRARALFGYRPKDLECFFTWWPERRPKWFHRLGFQRTLRISILDQPSSAINRLLDAKPRSVFGTPSYLYMISSLPDAHRLRELRPKLIVTTSELMDEKMRASIQDAFRGPVVDLYGSSEQNYISSECPQEGSHHLNMLNCLVEIARDGEPLSPGEEGEILITNLTNRAMPLIRYRTGDAGSISEEECPCGRHGEILEGLQGRCEDFLKAPNGMKVAPEILRRIVTGKVRGYRIVQETIHRFRIDYVADQLPLESRAEITRAFGLAMGDPDIQVLFRRVEEIEPDPSGKRRLVVCRA